MTKQLSPIAGQVIVLNFPGVTVTKRRPAVIVSTALYHATRPDIIVGLITSQPAAGPTDYSLRDWSLAGLHRPSVFRAFFVTLPRSAIISHLGELSASDWQEIRLRCQRAVVQPD